MRSDEKELWDALLDGQLDIDQLREPLMDHYSPQFVDAIRGLRELQAGLDRDGALMREVLTEAQEGPILDTDRGLLEHIPGDLTQATSTATIRRFAPWLALAAGLLLAVVGYRLSRPPGSPHGPSHGEELGNPLEVVASHPRGESTSFEEFRWSGPSRLGAWYVVHVQDEDSDQTWTSPKLTDRTWTPDPPLRAERIRWYVVYHPPGGDEPSSSPSVSASR